MGLDLYLEYHDPELNEDIELAYGRKTWNIADFFRGRCKEISTEYYHVSREDWNDFMAYFDKYDLDRIRDIVNKCGEHFYHYEEDVLSEEDFNLLKHFVEDITYEGDIPYLGYYWEAAALLRWHDASDEVNKAFDDGYEVTLIASY